MTLRRATSLIFMFFLVVPMGKCQNIDPFPYQLAEDWPSCAELRAMWWNLRNIASHSEITNEIPVIPTDLLNRAFHHRSAGHHGNHHGSLKMHAVQGFLKPQDSSYIMGSGKHTLSGNIHNAINPAFGAMDSMQSPKQSMEILPDHNPSSAVDFFGNFENDLSIHEPGHSPLFLVDEKTSNAKDLNRLGLTSSFPTDEERPEKLGFIVADEKESFSDSEPKWGLEEDIGSFGKFSDEDEEKARHNGNIRNHKSGSSRWHEALKKPSYRIESPASIQALCEPVENRECTQNEHCACSGWLSARCISGRCHVTSSSMPGDLMDIGAWHNGPLPHRKLGLVTRRRRSRSTKFM